MPSVLDAPSLTVIFERDEPTLLRLNAPLRWTGNGRWVQIPAGFVFDGASVPNTLYPLLDATALDLIIPGALHDYAYRQDALQIRIADQRIRGFTRLDADELFREVCRHCGFGLMDVAKLYYGVRAGGESSYAQKTVLG